MGIRHILAETGHPSIHVGFVQNFKSEAMHFSKQVSKQVSASVNAGAGMSVHHLSEMRLNSRFSVRSGWVALVRLVQCAVLFSFVSVSGVSAAEITGAGATFPYPVYAKWAESYKKVSGVSVNYQSIGSGAGIKQIKAKTVNFGASDMPLSVNDLSANGLVQFPAVMGGLVPVVNLDGIAPGQIRLTGTVLADIYLGKILVWNAPEIVALNPGVPLPATQISVIHRADGSGSTFLWTDYLSKVSPQFKSKVGSGTSVKWPLGVGAKGNEGLAANVLNIKGAIGYVEYAYVKKNKMKYTQLKNRDGVYVSPTDASFKAAAVKADWANVPGYAVVLTDQPGPASWPVTGASFILMQKIQADAAQGREVLKFFDWAYKNGAPIADALDYVMLPESVTALVENTWKTSISDVSGKSSW